MAFAHSLLSIGCAEDLDPWRDGATSDDSDGSGGFGGSNDSGDTAGKFPSRSGNFSHEVLTDGSTVQSVVDASDYAQWQFLDLKSGQSIVEDDAATSPWDLKFRRFFILSNGGKTGNGGVELTVLPDTEFSQVNADRVLKVMDKSWSVDQEDKEADDDHEADNVFNNGENDWYDYDSSDHTLTSKGLTYLVRGAGGQIFKVQVLDYYDGAGTPAFLSFRWAEVETN